MMDTFTYEAGAEHPGITLPWQEELTQNTWTDLDLSSGYSFTVRLVNSAGTDVVTKTTGITGADGSVTIAWAADELDIAAGTYTLRCRARETSTTKDRDFSPARPVRIVIV